MGMEVKNQRIVVISKILRDSPFESRLLLHFEAS
jgi:hypothetical protein